MCHFVKCIIFLMLTHNVAVIGEDLKPYSPHPKYRRAAYPHQKEVVVNPPPLLWPGTKEKYRVDVQLSSDKTFKRIEHEAKGIMRSCYSPHEVLKPGSWYWRYRHEGMRTWSTTYHFTVGNIPIFNPPSVSAVDIPRQHPRLLIHPNQKKSLEHLENTELKREIISHADKTLGSTVQTFTMPNKTPDLSESQYYRVAINKAKGYLGRLSLDVTYLCAAYLKIGDKKYGQRALDIAIEVSNMDQKLLHLNDFTHIKMLNIYMMAFDHLHDLMNNEEIGRFKKLLKQDFNDMYMSYAHNLETRIFDNHAWQKTLLTLLKGAIILKHHVPEADEWLEYAYSVWCCRAPATGFNHDGGWFNGTGYFSANMVTLQQFPLLLNWYTNFNFFSHPWFQKSAETLLSHWPVGSYSNGFGDGHGSVTNPRWKQALWMKTIAYANDDSVALGWAQNFAKDPSGHRVKGKTSKTKKHPYDEEMIEWYTLISTSPTVPKFTPFPKSRISATTGQVSFHSTPSDVNHNIFVSMRSSPFGSGSHTACNQNAFNLIAGGQPLFLSSGYYTNFSDRHNLLHYRHTRGHNTIMVNGQGQSIGTHAYGQLLRYAEGITNTGKNWFYAQGDASHAYQGIITDPMWTKKSKQAGVKLDEHNGYGATTLKRYHRHMIFIEPSTIILIDDLEAEENSVFTWLLHSPEPITQAKDHLATHHSSHRAEVRQWANVDVSTEITNLFEEPALNWSKKKVDGRLVEYKNQWHVKSHTVASKNVQFLTVIQVGEKSETFEPLKESDGSFKGSGWSVIVSESAPFTAKITIADDELNLCFDSVTKNTGGKSYTIPDIKMVDSN